jgi:hypothetical protein
MAAGKRMEGESLEDYRARLKEVKTMDRIITGGRWFWNASKHGTLNKQKAVRITRRGESEDGSRAE